jgi:hypothetical protein
MDQQIDLPYPVNVFYSYAPEDEGLRQELEKHLAALRRQGLIREWHAHKIGAGADRATTIDKHLMTASVILLLISPDFLASDNHYGSEVQKALQRQQTGAARVIPVLLRPVDWHGEPFEKLQYLPRDGRPITLWNNRDEAFQSVASDIREIIAQTGTFVDGVTHPSEPQPTHSLAVDRQTAMERKILLIQLLTIVGSALIYLFIVLIEQQYKMVVSFNNLVTLNEPYISIYICLLAIVNLTVLIWKYRHMIRQQWWKFPFSARPLVSAASLINLFLLVYSLLAYSQFLSGTLSANAQKSQQSMPLLNIQLIGTVSEGIRLPAKPEDYSPDDLSDPPVGVVHSYQVAQPPAVLPMYHVILELKNQTHERNVLTINQITLEIKQLLSLPSQLNIWKKSQAQMAYPAFLYSAEHNSYQVEGTHIEAYPTGSDSPEFSLVPGASTRVDVGLRSTWPVALNFTVEVSYTTNNISYTVPARQIFQVLFTDSENNWHFYHPHNQAGKFVPGVT